MALVFELLDENIPVVKLKPPRTKSPAVKVYVLVAERVMAAPSVTVPAVCVNNGAFSVPPLKLNAPDVNTKLVLGVMVPPVMVNVEAAAIVQVVQVMVPILLNVPAVYATAPEQVKLNVAKLIVPAV